MASDLATADFPISEELAPPPAPMAPSGLDGGEADIFGTFLIGGNEFAVSVSSIQEVVNRPEEFTNVPLSPDYLLGLFNLRGVIIPVVDLRSIFGLTSDSANVADAKVAIIEHGTHCFGLLVDRTGDVFNARDVDRNEVSRVRGDVRESIIGGIFKLENGQRLVQILDPFELLKLEKLPRVTGTHNSALTRRKRGRRKQCISFEVGDCICAFDMKSIKEIVELQSIDNTALAHGSTLGAIDLRGSTVPVIDFRVFLGKQEPSTAQELAGKGYKLIVMKLGDYQISLLVDGISNIVSYFDDDLVTFPGVGMERTEMFLGCLSSHDDEMVLLLDHNKILGDEELADITMGHSKLFSAEDNTAQEADHAAGNKRTFITFFVGSKFALDIESVNEVMSFPESIVHPPSLPSFIEGMVNLRGELIPIINLRALYNLDAIDSSMTKLLIFTCNEKKYGFMVDTVDSIVSLSGKNSSALPRIFDGGQSLDISNDVKEAILIENDNEDERSLMILDLEMVISRTVAIAGL